METTPSCSILLLPKENSSCSTLNTDESNMSSKSEIDLKMSELEKEISKTRSWSDQDIQELINVIPAEQIKLLLKHEIRRMDGWFSKTYYPFNSFLIKNNYIKWNKNDPDFEMLKSKMDFISGCLDSVTPISTTSTHQVNYNFYPDNMMNDFKKLEKNICGNYTIQIVDQKLCRCLLCLKMVCGNIYEHVRGGTHQANLLNLDLLDILNSFHNGWSEIPQTLRINELFFLPNSTTLSQCCVCDKIVAYGALLEHINGKNHQNKISKIITLPSSSNSETKSESNVKSEKLDNQVQCDICNISVARVGLEEHINGRNHQKNLSQVNLFSESKSEPIEMNNQVKCDICNTLVGRVQLQEHINGKTHQKNLSQINHVSVSKFDAKSEQISNQVRCDICNIVVTRGGLSEHINGRNHQQNLSQISLVNKSKSDINLKKIDTYSQVECVICNIIVARVQLEEHTCGKYHQKNVVSEIISEIETNNQVQCDICNIVLSRRGLSEHINGRIHQVNLSKINLIYKSKSKVITKSEIIETNNQVECDICNIVVSRGGFQEHINGRNHQKNVSQSITLPISVEQAEIQSKVEQMKILTQKDESNQASTSKQADKKEIKKEIQIPTNNPQLSSSVYFADFYVVQLYRTVSNTQWPLTIQQISQNFYRCLVCRTMLIHKNILNLHVNNEEHQRKYNNSLLQSALKIYHTVWKTIPKYESQQIFFFPYDNLSVYCTLCSLVVKYSQIRGHCCLDINKFHTIEAIDGNMWKVLEDANNLFSKESDKLFKKTLLKGTVFVAKNVFHRTEQFYSDDLLKKLEKKERIRKTIIMSNSNTFNCLICQKERLPRSSLEKHYSSTVHRSNMNSRFCNGLAEKFHSDWSKFPADFQLHQIYYLPDVVNYTCICCDSKNISAESILCHTYGSKHVNKFKEYHLNEIPKHFDLVDESLNINIYPESLLQLLKTITPNREDYILITIQQIELFNMKCLLCKTKFENLQSHIRERNHIMNIRDEFKIKSLKVYHLEWKKIPNQLQIQQLDFEPYDEYRVKCLKCGDFLHYVNLNYHLTNNHQFIETQTDLQIPQQNVTNVHKFTPFTYYPINLVQKMKVLEGKLYRNVQMINDSEYRCLLCKIFMDNLDDHVLNSDHLKKLLDKNLIAYVDKFHNSWAFIDNCLQFQQKYFYPAGETIIYCALCQENISYNKLYAHLNIPKHSCLTSTIKNVNMLKSSSTTLDSLSKNSQDNSTDSNSNDDEDSESDGNEEHSTSDDNTGDSEENLNNTISVDKDEFDTKNNLELNEIWESLPERLNINRTVIYWKDGIYSCHICHVNLQPNKTDIVSHVVKKSHIIVLRTCGVYQRKWDRLIYECLYCNKRIHRNENDWQIHLKSAKHVALSKQKNFENFAELYCKTCGFVLYGDKNILRDHKHAGKKAKNKELKMPNRLQTLFKSSTVLEKFVDDLFNQAMDVLLNNRDEEVCKSLIDSMKLYIDNTEICKAYRFGSRVTGLCSKDSDLDIFLDINGVYNGIKDQQSETQSFYVNLMHTVLKKYPNIWTHFEPIPQARTPILRVFHEPTKIDCDISFRNGLSVENTKLLSFYLNLQPLTRKVILFLKVWSYQFEFDQRINNYALSLMVIFCLQTKGFLYSVSQLRKMYKGPPKSITGWDCTFYNDLMNIVNLPCNLSHLEILRDFFQYYTSFNYDEDVICPLLGRIIPKKDFHLNEECDTLPAEMKCYIDYIKSDIEAELFRSLSPLCVQDPFDLSHNLTKAVPPHMVIKFSKACQISYKSLNDILTNNSS